MQSQDGPSILHDAVVRRGILLLVAMDRAGNVDSYPRPRRKQRYWVRWLRVV